MVSDEALVAAASSRSQVAGKTPISLSICVGEPDALPAILTESAVSGTSQVLSTDSIACSTPH